MPRRKTIMLMGDPIGLPLVNAHLGTQPSEGPGVQSSKMTRPAMHPGVLQPRLMEWEVGLESVGNWGQGAGSRAHGLCAPLDIHLPGSMSIPKNQDPHWTSAVSLPLPGPELTPGCSGPHGATMNKKAWALPLGTPDLVRVIG